MARVAAAKGDDDEAKASNPLRLTPDRPKSLDEEAPGDEGVLLVLLKAEGLKMEGPFAEAKGDEEEA